MEDNDDRQNNEKHICYGADRRGIDCCNDTLGALRQYGEHNSGGTENGGQLSLLCLGKEEDDAAYFDGFQAENRVTLIAPNGTVLYDSKEEAASMENHSGREEVQEALEKGVGRVSDIPLH